MQGSRNNEGGIKELLCYLGAFTMKSYFAILVLLLQNVSYVRVIHKFVLFVDIILVVICKMNKGI